MGGGAGGPTILDLQSGALSLQDKFIDVWVAFNMSKRKPFTRSEVAVYRAVADRLESGALPRPGPLNRSLSKLQGLLASRAHLWR